MQGVDRRLNDRKANGSRLTIRHSSIGGGCRGSAYLSCCQSWPCQLVLPSAAALTRGLELIGRRGELTVDSADSTDGRKRHEAGEPGFEAVVCFGHPRPSGFIRGQDSSTPVFQADWVWVGFVPKPGSGPQRSCCGRKSESCGSTTPPAARLHHGGLARPAVRGLRSRRVDEALIPPRQLLNTEHFKLKTPRAPRGISPSCRPRLRRRGE